MARKTIVILGSTGSIGRQSLQEISSRGGLAVSGLAAGANWRLLAAQAAALRPDAVAIADASAMPALRSAVPARTKVLAGPDAMTELVRLLRPDILLTAIVGMAGMEPTLAGIRCGSTLAIANKETLVTAGALVMPAAKKAGVPVIPVDSEHSAIFQCLRAGRPGEVRRVIITASGGAMRDTSDAVAARAGVRQALNHPTWRMGRKITIDSATMMNKALEVVEAHWLFGLPAEKIHVLIHPESIVHALVEFRDGSIVAQLARPDMKIPIAYALNCPGRPARRVPPLDLAAIGGLTFRALSGRFALAVALGASAIRRGGLAGAVLNGANEAAVEAFLAGRILLGGIVPLVAGAMKNVPSGRASLAGVMAADAMARSWVKQAIGAGRTAPTANRKAGERCRR